MLPETITSPQNEPIVLTGYNLYTVILLVYTAVWSYHSRMEAEQLFRELKCEERRIALQSLTLDMR